ELAIAERLEARQRACVDHGRVALHLPLTTCCSENLSAQGVRQFYGSEWPLVQSRGLRAECLQSASGRVALIKDDAEGLALWRDAVTGAKHVHHTDADNVSITDGHGNSRSFRRCSPPSPRPSPM